LPRSSSAGERPQSDLLSSNIEQHILRTVATLSAI
jgi:hypothetical protein